MRNILMGVAVVAAMLAGTARSEAAWHEPAVQTVEYGYGGRPVYFGPGYYEQDARADRWAHFREERRREEWRRHEEYERWRRHQQWHHHGFDRD